MLIRNPKLIIIDYYDSLIRQVDIYTEEQLEKYPREKVIDKDSFGDQLPAESINLHDFLNQKRDEYISEIKKAEKEAFEHFESIKSELRVLDKSAREEEIERDLKSRLFEKKSMFIWSVDDNPKLGIEWAKKPFPFKLLLFVFDFYLNKNEQELLK